MTGQSSRNSSQLSRGEAEALFERLSRKAERRRRLRPFKSGLLTVVVVAVTLAGSLGLYRIFSPPSAGRGTLGTAGSAGRIAFARGGAAGGIYVMNADGTSLTRVTTVSGDTEVTWSHDGTKLAFVRFEAGNANIYVVGVDGSGLTRLTNLGADSGPAWSPDGTRIAFARETVGNSDIYLMDADGSNVQRLTGAALLESGPSWSPDGTMIAFHALPPYNGKAVAPVRVFVMESDGRGQRAVGPKDGAQPSWSPDSTRLALVDEKSGSILVVNRDGSDLRELSAAGDVTSVPGITLSPTWSPDGTMIAFSSGENVSATRILVINVDGSGLTALTSGQAGDSEPAWGP